MESQINLVGASLMDVKGQMAMIEASTKVTMAMCKEP